MISGLILENELSCYSNKVQENFNKTELAGRKYIQTYQNRTENQQTEINNQKSFTFLFSGANTHTKAKST